MRQFLLCADHAGSMGSVLAVSWNIHFCVTSYPSKALLDSGESLASFPGSGVLGGVFFSFGKLFYGHF